MTLQQNVNDNIIHLTSDAVYLVMSVACNIMQCNETLLKTNFILNEGWSLSWEVKAQACCCTAWQNEVGDQQSRRRAQINSSPVKWAVRG